MNKSSLHRAHNRVGNAADEHNMSYFVVDEDDEKVLGPFATASYAIATRDRMPWHSDLHIVYARPSTGTLEYVERLRA